jgi:hypothetical protein
MSVSFQAKVNVSDFKLLFPALSLILVKLKPEAMHLHKVLFSWIVDYFLFLYYVCVVIFLLLVQPFLY